METISLPNMFVQVLLSLVAIMMIVYYALGIWKEHFREQPIPSQTYAREADCKQRHAAVFALDSECKQRAAGALNEIAVLRNHFEKSREKETADAAERRKGIYDMIHQTENVLRGELNLMRSDTRMDFKGVHERIDEVLGAVRELKGKVEA